MSATFAQGASGRIVRETQELLSRLQVPASGGGHEPALDPSNSNGLFERPITRHRVQRAQSYFQQPAIGELGRQLWARLTAAPSPDEYERSLGLIAPFEGHNSPLAAGNYEGSGITWGDIGFTLLTNLRAKSGPTQGSLHTLLSKIIEKHPDLFDKAFGTMLAPVLQNKLKSLRPDARLCPHKAGRDVGVPDSLNLVHRVRSVS